MSWHQQVLPTKCRDPHALSGTFLDKLDELFHYLGQSQTSLFLQEKIRPHTSLQTVKNIEQLVGIELITSFIVSCL